MKFLFLPLVFLVGFSSAFNADNHDQNQAYAPVDCYEYSINMYNLSLAAGNTEEEAKVDGYNALEGCLEIKEGFN